MRRSPARLNQKILDEETFMLGRCKCDSGFPGIRNNFVFDDDIPTSQITHARDEALKAILEELKIPTLATLKGKHIGRFRKWCQKHDIDPDTQTTGGTLFGQYVVELEKKAKAQSARAVKIKDLLKVEGRMWTSAEAVQEDEEVNGWNSCLFDYIKTGKIPSENTDAGDLHARARAMGYNKARKQLIVEKGS